MPLDGPPELTSSQFWGGPGAGTFFTSAATLEALVALLASILGGHQAAAAGQAGAWGGPAGALALAAEIPYFAWLVDAMAQIEAAAAQIGATGEAFETLKAATPTPGEVAENQAEHAFLQAANIPALGALTPAITANRIEYMRKWITGSTNMYSYAAASAAGVQAIPPLPPPMPTATPASGDVGDAAQLANDKPLQKAMQGAEAPTDAMGQLTPLLSSLTSAPSELSGMGGGGGLLSGLTSLPQQAMSPFMSMLGQFGNGGGLDGPGAADAALAPWTMGSPAAGGPVSAALSGGGGLGGLGGVGSAPLAPLRGPLSWGSTVNAAAPEAAPETPVSRIAEARAASTMPATSGAMGSPGMAMSPLARANRGDGDGKVKGEFAARAWDKAAQQYAAVGALPVVTGSGGAVFGSGEEDR
jgi:PPE-repeat protein